MLGGIPLGSRELFDGDDPYSKFEQTVELLFGERLRQNKDDANAFWGALANVTWINKNGEEVGYSFRAGGDLIAAIRKDIGTMTYMNYYCMVPDATVPEWVSEPMHEMGWDYVV